MSAHILIADDDEVSCQLFAETLESEGFRVDQTTSGEAALSRLREDTPDLLIIDVRMPGTSGLEVTRIVHEKYPSLPIIVMTAFGSIETAVEAIHEGAFDFISKPMNLAELKKTVSRALAQWSLQRNAEMSNGGGDENLQQLGEVIGKSPAMVEVYKTVARVAPTKSTVLVLGESGTGKELIARAIHQHSPDARSWRWTAGCSRKLSWRVSCSAMCAALLPARWPTKKGCSKRPRGAPAFSTRSGISAQTCRPNSCGSCKNTRSGGSAARIGSRSMSGWSPRPTATWPSWCVHAPSVTICITV